MTAVHGAELAVELTSMLRSLPAPQLAGMLPGRNTPSVAPELAVEHGTLRAKLLAH